MPPNGRSDGPGPFSYPNTTNEAAFLAKMDAKDITKFTLTNWTSYSGYANNWIKNTLPADNNAQLAALATLSRKRSLTEVILMLNYVRTARFLYEMRYFDTIKTIYATTVSTETTDEDFLIVCKLLAKDAPWQVELSDSCRGTLKMSYSSSHLIYLLVHSIGSHATNLTDNTMFSKLQEFRNLRPRSEEPITISQLKMTFNGKYQEWRTHLEGGGKKLLWEQIAKDFNNFYRVTTPSKDRAPSPTHSPASTKTTTATSNAISPKTQPPAPTTPIKQESTTPNKRSASPSLASASKRGRRQPPPTITILDDDSDIEELVEHAQSTLDIKEETAPEDLNDSPLLSDEKRGQVILQRDLKGLTMAYRRGPHISDVDCSCAKPVSDITTELSLALSSTNYRLIYIYTFVDIFTRLEKVIRREAGRFLCDTHLAILGATLGAPLGETQSYNEWWAELREIVNQLVDEELPPRPELPFLKPEYVAHNNGIRTQVRGPTIMPFSTSPRGDWLTTHSYVHKGALDHLTVASTYADDHKMILHHARGNSGTFRYNQGTYSLAQQAIQMDEKLYDLAVQLRMDSIITLGSYPLAPLVWDGSETCFIEGDIEVSAATGVGLDHIDLYAIANPLPDSVEWSFNTLDTSACTSALGPAAFEHLDAPPVVGAPTTFNWAKTQTGHLREILTNALLAGDPDSSSVTRSTRDNDPDRKPLLKKQKDQKRGDVVFTRSNNVVVIRADTDESRAYLSKNPVLFYRNRYIPLFGNNEMGLLATERLPNVTGTNTLYYKQSKYSPTSRLHGWHENLWVPWKDEISWNASIKVAPPTPLNAMLKGTFQYLDPNLIDHLKGTFVKTKLNPIATKLVNTHTDELLNSVKRSFFAHVILEMNQYQGRSYYVADILQQKHHFDEDYLDLSVSSKHLSEKDRERLRAHPASFGVVTDTWVEDNPARYDGKEDSTLNHDHLMEDFNKAFKWLEKRFTQRSTDRMQEGTPATVSKLMRKRTLGPVRFFTPDPPRSSE